MGVPKEENDLACFTSKARKGLGAGRVPVTTIRLAFVLSESKEQEKGTKCGGGRAPGQTQGFENRVWLCFHRGQISEMEIHRTSGALHKLGHGT